jgi:H+-transporting ATPase
VGLHKYVEAAVIAGLLVFNAALAWFQEGRAQATLNALRSRLALNASVRRDGVWKTVAAAELVRGDCVKLSLGGVVAADVHLVDGSVLLDQSMLTGESLPIEAGAGVDTYAGALVRRGEATAEVTATGVHTKFGRTAELVRTAHVVSSQQKAVLRIVRNLAFFNGGIILLIGTYAWFHAMPWAEIFRCCSHRSWRLSRSHCPRPLRSRRLWGLALLLSQASCLLGSRRLTKQRPSMFCARIKPGH